MKKLIFFAAFAVAVSSCKKESLTTLPGNTTASFDRTSVEEVIKAADPNLYERVKSAFHPNEMRATSTPIIRFAHGIYNENVWYCYPANCICFIEIIDSRFSASNPLPSEGDKYTELITKDIHESYTTPADVHLVVMKNGSPFIYNNISRFDVSVANNYQFAFQQAN